MNRYLSTALLGLITLSPFAAFAQEAPSMVPDGSGQTSSELESCFDYYRFGSVPVTITSDTIRIAQGAVLNLKATVTNQNAYPVDNVAVYAKVLYKKNFDKNSYGPDVVDFFPLGDYVNLKAGESKVIQYKWNVPAGIEPGNYQIAGYVASHDRFNLAGLTFSNDVVGNLFNFSVAGEDTGAVRFDNTKTVLNGVGFHAAIFPPHSDIQANGVPLTAVVENTTNAAYSGSVHWEVYSWDGINPSNLITTSDQDISVPAHASTTVSYSIKDQSHTVYYIMGTLTTGKTGPKSMLTVRYISSAVDGSDIPRIAFVGATAYPAVKGDTKIFACIHTTGRKESDNVRLEVSARPLDPLSWFRSFGKLASRTYEGVAPGAVSAVSVPFSANSNNFAVTAKLFQNGKLIDQVTSNFSCDAYGSSCSHLSWLAVAIIGLVIVLIVIALVLFILRRRRSAAPRPFTTTPTV